RRPRVSTQNTTDQHKRPPAPTRALPISFHQRGGHPAVPGPDLGAAAKGTAVHLARPAGPRRPAGGNGTAAGACGLSGGIPRGALDRKSTRLNSSHASISYAVFCLNNKKV